MNKTRSYTLIYEIHTAKFITLFILYSIVFTLTKVYKKTVWRDSLPITINLIK